MAVQHVTAAGSTVFSPNGCRVKSIHWVGGTTAGHLLEIQDAAGNHLYGSQAAGQYNEIESITDRNWPTGFKVTTLDSGYVDVETYDPGTSVF